MSKKDIVGAINNCKWLTLSERRILIGLWSFWLKSKMIYARQKYFAENWNVGYSTVRRGLKRFSIWGIVGIEERKGTSNLIKFKCDEITLIGILEKDEPPNVSKEQPSNTSEQLDDLNEHANPHNEQGGVLQFSTHNTELNTNKNTEENIDLDTEVDTYKKTADFIENSISYNDEFNIGDIEYALEQSEDINHLQLLFKRHKDSNQYDAIKEFQIATGKRLVMLNGSAIDASNYFTVYDGDTIKRTVQMKFDRTKFVVLDTSNFKEITSHYE